MKNWNKNYVFNKKIDSKANIVHIIRMQVKLHSFNVRTYFIK